jgi:acyl carrier protein
MISQDEFLKKIRGLFDETEESLIQIETRFKELEEWSSLIVLSLIVMFEEDLNSKIAPNEIEKSITINDLFQFALNNVNKDA